MTSLALMLMAPALLGVDFGWQPVAGGGIQYIIRLDADQLESLKNGEDILSDLPPNMDVVHTYRITAVAGELPNQGVPPRKHATSLLNSTSPTPAAAPAGANYYPANNGYPANNYPANNNYYPISPPGGFNAPSNQYPNGQQPTGSQPLTGPSFPNFPSNPGYNGPNQAAFPNQNAGVNYNSAWNPNGTMVSANTSHFGPPSTSTFDVTPQPTLTNRPQDPNGFVNQGHAPQVSNVSKVIPNPTWVATIVALGLSLGANCYLGMLSVSLYNRCRVLLGQLRFSTLRS